MAFSPQLAKAVESLNYRVTVGEVASQAGINLNIAQAGLLDLASNAGGHLQVAETGDIVYEFPRNFRAILRNKYFKIRLREWLEKVWNVAFYIIRISFGIALILSIVLMTIAILVLIIAASSSRDDNSSGGGSRRSGGSFNMPMLIWWGPDLFNVFRPNYYRRRRSLAAPQIPTVRDKNPSDMNFLEAVFSFIFGDGDPNADLDERRWQTIGQVIRNNNGAVIAEQIAPYLDDLSTTEKEEESYMLGVLARFNGYPEVSPEGDIIYYFPELQVMAQERSKTFVPAYLAEEHWQFTAASQLQKFLAMGLGGVNIVLALMLGAMLQDQEIVYQLGGFIAFINGLFPVLLGYAIAFLAIPLFRYFWLQNRNNKIKERNLQRQSRAAVLAEGYPQIQNKLKYAQQFSAQNILAPEDITYSTEQDLLDQSLERQEKIDIEWQKRLDQEL